MEIDLQHMHRALDLARVGVGLASPNPMVGAVVVDNAGREVGAGTHTYDGVTHAEVLAIERAGEKTRGATLYINLEPCSHQGRTGPCADAVIASGITRVVCAMQDPNGQVSGRGFAKLRAAGIQVDVGPLEIEARKLNESFAKYIRTGKPFVTLKSALSLDGKIAAANDVASSVARSGNSWITGEAARAHVQQLRHQHDAILVGVGTVIADDPLLTDRSGLPRRRKLLRVILDSSLRTPLHSRLLDTVEDDVLILCSAVGSADKQRRQAIEAKGVHVEEVAADSNSRPKFAAIVDALGSMQYTSVMIEGGSHVNAAALASGEVDKLFFYYAPLVFGVGAVPFLAGGNETDSSRVSNLKIEHCEWQRFDEDFALEGYLRDPYSA